MDVGLSVTRVGSAAQWDGMKLVGSAYKLELAQYMELQSFSQFASDLGEDTKARLSRGVRLVELLKQSNGTPETLGLQVLVLSIANQDLISALPKRLLPEMKSILLNIPTWVCLFITPRIIGTSVIASLGS